MSEELLGVIDAPDNASTQQLHELAERLHGSYLKSLKEKGIKYVLVFE